MNKTIILGLALATLSTASYYCGENERPIPGNGCDCKLGYARLDGYNCEKCPVNGHWEPNADYGRGSCVCNWGFDYVYGECVAEKTYQHYGYGY